jgi:hypothetical protein
MGAVDAGNILIFYYVGIELSVLTEIVLFKLKLNFLNAKLIAELCSIGVIVFILTPF